jgi:hypothetical protein
VLAVAVDGGIDDDAARRQQDGEGEKGLSHGRFDGRVMENVQPMSSVPV